MMAPSIAPESLPNLPLLVSFFSSPYLEVDDNLSEPTRKSHESQISDTAHFFTLHVGNFSTAIAPKTC
jgi:hypothetical protein